MNRNCTNVSNISPLSTLTKQVHADFKLACTRSGLALDLVVPYVYVQVGKYQSVSGTERPPTVLVSVRLISESHWAEKMSRLN